MNGLSVIGRTLVVIALALFVVGVVLLLFGRVLDSFGYRGLPGDLRFTIGRTEFFFPIASSIIASVVLTVLLNIATWFLQRR